MAFSKNTNSNLEDVVERIQDTITIYLQFHFLVIRLANTGDAYAFIPDPKYLEHYINGPGPLWLAKLVDKRKKLPLEISLNFCMFNLFLRSYEVEKEHW